MSKLTAASLFTLLLAAAGCASAPGENDITAETETESAPFSVLPVTSTTSILPVVESRAGKLRVCLALIGFPASGRSTASAKLQAGIRGSLSGWNALFAGNPDWHVATVSPVFTVQTTECSARAQDLRINVWNDAATFTSDYCARFPGWTCSSAGDTPTRTVNIGPVNRGLPEDIYDPYIILHEYGHMIGLADTYTIPGSIEWVGTAQPPRS